MRRVLIVTEVFLDYMPTEHRTSGLEMVRHWVSAEHDQYIVNQEAAPGPSALRGCRNWRMSCCSLPPLLLRRPGIIL